MTTDLLVKKKQGIQCEPELSSQLEDLLNKGSCLLKEKKEIWSLREDIEKIPAFNYLINKNIDTPIAHKNSDLLAIESNQVIYWLIERIELFDIADKENLNALLFLIHSIDDNQEFWVSLKNNNVVPHIKLIEFAVGAIESTKLIVEFRLLTDFHIRESQERFESIISSKSWYDIYEDLHRSGQSFKFEIDFILHQAANLLVEFEFERLLSALESNKNIPFLWGLMDIVGKGSALLIANKTKSDIVEFSALASSLPFPSKEQLSIKEEDLLCQMFLRLTKDESKFEHWMNILNKYPSRYPQIQPSLGKALATSDSKRSVHQYVDTIYLGVNSGCRECVATCLESFEQWASQSLKKSAWELAFIRWDKWKFGTNSKKEHLFDIQVSALDYAVTKYYLESLSKIEREKVLEEIQDKMFDIENMWHASSSKLTTFWYLCLSQLQPLYHILQIEADNNLPLLMTGRTYSPTQIVGNRYIDMFIRV